MFLSVSRKPLSHAETVRKEYDEEYQQKAIKRKTLIIIIIKFNKLLLFHATTSHYQNKKRGGGPRKEWGIIGNPKWVNNFQQILFEYCKSKPQ